jgi:hypothetical protein
MNRQSGSPTSSTAVKIAITPGAFGAHHESDML